MTKQKRYTVERDMNIQRSINELFVVVDNVDLSERTGGPNPLIKCANEQTANSIARLLNKSDCELRQAEIQEKINELQKELVKCATD